MTHIWVVRRQTVNKQRTVVAVLAAVRLLALGRTESKQAQ